MFDKLDPDNLDKDGTLDHKELHGRLRAKKWAVADPDNDGTLDAKELATPAGHALLRLLE